MLENKISTLDAALEVAKDEISKSFVEGFNGALKQFQVVQPNVDTSMFDPFKSVIDGKIVTMRTNSGPSLFEKLFNIFQFDQSSGQTNLSLGRIVLCPPDPYRAEDLLGDP
ncbi:hypothetical protein VNO80_11703 [Phaseolus coccineus]|uniref:Uncharacterized protein n=1 Tax=Phaseolus coccineus TaxID=3886 RepID=A0AAN9NB17_PHACN